MRLRFPEDGSVVDVPDLTLEAGRRLALFGPNGAGKSTLLRLLAGTLAGAGGIDASYLPQRPHMFSGSVAWNLSLGLKGSEKERAVLLAERFGLIGSHSRPAGMLSGGETQRLALARVLAAGSEWVLLDEPFGPLDARDRMDVASGVVEAIGERGAVIVTHDLDEAAAVADEMAVMIGGRVRQRADVGTVLAQPADEDVAQVVGVGNALAGTVAVVDGPLCSVNMGAITAWGLGAVDVGERAKVLFGGESVTVYPGTDWGSGSARNRWTGTVSEIRRDGQLFELIVDAGVPLVAIVTPGSLEGLGLAVGESVTLTVKATAVRVVPG